MDQRELLPGWDTDEKHQVLLHPMIGYAYAAVQPAHIALAIRYVTSPEEMTQVRARRAEPRSLQIRIDPATARRLAQRLLETAQIIEDQTSREKSTE